MKGETYAKIRLIVTDCDGVLTDGGLYYGNDGEALKKFNAKDGMAFTILNKTHSIEAMIITGGHTKMTERRANKFKLPLYQGIANKVELLDQLLISKKISWEEVAYIGDDINDLECIRKVGLSACPKDAVTPIKKTVDYQCQLKGGEGCFRELVDLILAYR